MAHADVYSSDSSELWPSALIGIEMRLWLVLGFLLDFFGGYNK